MSGASQEVEDKSEYCQPMGNIGFWREAEEIVNVTVSFWKDIGGVGELHS